MSEQVKQKISMIGIVALLLSNFAYMADLVIIPAYSYIFSHFSDASDLLTNFIASGSQITLIVGCLIAPMLMKHFSKKHIIVVGFGIFTAVATCSGIVDDAGFVAVMRGITGLFMGFITPTATALIIELFRYDDKKRAKYIGWFDGSMAGIGAVILIISGILASYGWQAIFLEYLIGVPIWIMLLLFIPKTPADKYQDYDEPAKEGTNDKKDTHVKVFSMKTLIAIFLSFALCNMFYGALVYEFSIYLAENFVLPAYMNGLLGAIKGVLGAIMGFLVFAPLFARVKRFTITICFAAQAVAYFGLMVILPDISGILWFLLCYSFIGIAFGLSVPYYYSYTAMVFPQKNMSLVTSLMTVAMALGAFFSTYFVTLLQTLFGFETYTPVMPYIGACCLVAAVLTVIVGLRDPYRKTAFLSMQKDTNKIQNEESTD